MDDTEQDGLLGGRPNRPRRVRSVYYMIILALNCVIVQPFYEHDRSLATTQVPPRDPYLPLSHPPDLLPHAPNTSSAATHDTLLPHHLLPQPSWSTS